MVDAKAVVIAFIPEAPCHDKPVYIKTKGPTSGAYRRIGATDQLCTDSDIEMFYQERGQKTYDENVLANTSLADIDPEALLAYRNAKKQFSSEGAADLLAFSDRELLYALGATDSQLPDAKLTLCGLILFGSRAALRRVLPMARIDYIRVDGREWVPDSETRYSTIERLEPLMLSIPNLITQILNDIPRSFSLESSGVHRKDIPLVPREVIREAVVNALMHRSYRTNQPVQIIRYANRIEIKNAGHSLIPDERLGDPGSKSRNPKIAATLHDAGLAETKGTGIRVMREAMNRANLTMPLIESDRKRDDFTLTLLVHNLYGPEDVKWLEQFKGCSLSSDDACVMVVLREIGYLDNAIYRSVTRVDSLTASSRLRRLRDSGLLETCGKGATTYYVPGPRMLGGGNAKKRIRREPLRRELTDALRRELESLRRDLPPSLGGAIGELGRRASQDALNDIIHRLCSWRPLSSRELSLLLERDEEHLQRRNIKRLMSEGRIGYLHPEQINHPQQKYIPTDES